MSLYEFMYKKECNQHVAGVIHCPTMFKKMWLAGFTYLKGSMCQLSLSMAGSCHIMGELAGGLVGKPGKREIMQVSLSVSFT